MGSCGNDGVGSSLVPGGAGGIFLQKSESRPVNDDIYDSAQALGPVLQRAGGSIEAVVVVVVGGGSSSHHSCL